MRLIRLGAGPACHEPGRTNRRDELVITVPIRSFVFDERAAVRRQLLPEETEIAFRRREDGQRHTLKLTAHAASGIGHMGLRVRDDETLQRLVSHLAARNVTGTWVEDVGHGAASPAPITRTRAGRASRPPRNRRALTQKASAMKKITMTPDDIRAAPEIEQIGG